MTCLSGILMGAFTASLVFADLWFWRSDRVITHGILGGIITFLFFALCQRGYELVNWSLLGLMLLILLVVPLLNSINVFPESDDDSSENSSDSSSDESSCCSCARKCSCQKPRCPVKKSCGN